MSCPGLPSALLAGNKADPMEVAAGAPPRMQRQNLLSIYAKASQAIMAEAYRALMGFRLQEACSGQAVARDASAMVL